MKKVLNRIVFLLVVLFSAACTDIIEINLEGQSVDIILPANNYVSAQYNQLFKWEELKGADQYQLQIVQPDFGNIQSYVLDTNVTGTEFNFTLSPGTYQWRLRGVNSISTSDYITRTIIIDSTMNLSGQNVLLISPGENFFSNNSDLTFKWQLMPTATNYLFQVLSAGTVIHTQSLSVDSASYSFLADGSYQWRVIAQNEQSSSAFATRDITIDNSVPTAATLLLPVHGDTVSNPVTLTWNSDASAIGDSVFIYADSSLIVLLEADYVISQSHTFSGTAGEDYFWRIRTRDAADNWSVYSAVRKFLIEP